jgi:FixJ family two-component response regulator
LSKGCLLLDVQMPRMDGLAVRTALQDAASVAGLLVTTEAMVAEKKPETKAPMPAGAGMGDMDF